MDDFAAMNEVYEKRECIVFHCTSVELPDSSTVLPTPKPARTCISALKLPNDVDVEIEAIAAA